MSSTKKTELHVAVESKDIKQLKKVLTSTKSKKIKEMLTSFDSEGQTPLIIALKNNDGLSLDLILGAHKELKVDINTKDRNGYTALHQGVVMSEDKIIVRLLQYDGIDVDVQNDDKNRPIHYFCQKYKSPNCSEPFAAFIAKRCDINAQNNNGETPLHKAIFNNSVRLLMVNLLLKHGANVNLLNNLGESSLHYAVRLGRDDLVSVLLKAGADVTIAGARERKTPLQLAIDERHQEMAARIQKHKALLDWLHDHGMDAYQQQFVKEELYLDVLPDVEEKTLEKMNIAAGHRLKILKIARTLSQSNNKTPTQSNGLKKEESVLNIFSESDDGVNNEAAVNSLRESLLHMKHTSSGPAPIIQDSELEFTEKLGSGSSGKVYKGLYKGQEVAIKVLKSMTEQKEIDEFKKEFQIMSAIRSKYVVLFHGAVLEPKLCMVMELCSRCSLFHVMSNEDYDIGWDKTFRFAIEMVRGMEQLHGWDPPIVHRDLKSLNLLVTEKWDIKVCDFGLSRFNTGSNIDTLVKMRGTFAYCSPEVYFGEQFSTKSDVYSIGMVLWELVTRCITGKYERPFAEFKNLQFDFQIIIQTAKKGLRPTIPPTCPENFVNLIKECFDHSPDKRPSCSEILAKLLTLHGEYQENQTKWETTRIKSE